MKNKTTIYHLILDKSSSMNNCRTQTIAGFNAQVSTIKELQETYPDQEFMVSLTVFNDTVQHLIDTKNVKEIELLREHNYRPNGMTALLDAIGESVKRIDLQYQHQIKAQQISVIVVVLTDGFENASEKFDYRTISSIIKEKEDSNQWTFSFMGADIDAVHAAQNLNIRQENIISFNKEKMSEVMESVNESIRDYAFKKEKGITKSNFLDMIKKKDMRK